MVDYNLIEKKENEKKIKDEKNIKSAERNNSNINIVKNLFSKKINSTKIKSKLDNDFIGYNLINFQSNLENFNSFSNASISNFDDSNKSLNPFPCKEKEKEPEISLSIFHFEEFFIKKSKKNSKQYINKDIKNKNKEKEKEKEKGKEKEKEKEKFIVKNEKRNFTFPIKDNSKYKITCEKLSICKSVKESPFSFKIRIKRNSKRIIIFTLYLFLWIYIAIFMKNIYSKYGDNIFKICIFPLISSIIIKFFFTINLTIFISAIVLYHKGKIIINNKKPELFWKIIFDIFVPNMSLNHYIAIVNFVDFNKIR
jgi:hypothetical protein